MSGPFRVGGTWDWRPSLAVLTPSITLLALTLCTAAIAQEASDEYRLKAGFLYRFPQFVEWPAHVLEGRTTVDICVLEPNPFGGVLEALVEGEQLEGRGLKIRHLRGVQFDDCHILYVPRTQVRRSEMLRRVTESSILTVSDAPTFLDEGGMIQLFLRDNRLRFSINADATDRARIRLSAQLLRLAQTVRRRPS